MPRRTRERSVATAVATTQPEAARASSSTTLVAVVIALLLVSLLTIRVSAAVFSQTTSNDGNSISVGNVELTDDDADAALITLTDAGPGDAATGCIEVTYGGTMDPAAVKLYSGGYTDSASLDTDVDLTIEVGGALATCASFGVAASSSTTTLEAFGANTTYADGSTVFDPTGAGQTRAVRITATVAADAASSQQDQSITDLEFVFEVRSS